MPSPSPTLLAARTRVGTRVDGRWRLDALLAVGGCSAIYAATHRNGHRVAMKIFDADLASNPAAVAHFQREGRVANGIGHPGVVAVVDDGTTEDGSPFLLMPLLEGETAQQRLARHPNGLPALEALAVVEAVLDVLVAAHDRGIVHRDLKPDNVFLERSGGIRVLDFGIARVADNPDATACGTVMGTPGYMAPEQARGSADEVGPRSDLWSVGALMYSLLTGRVLHEAPTPLASVLLAQREPVPAAREIVPGASDAVADVLDGALAYESSRRWMDATAMRWAVRAAIHAGQPGRPAAGSCGGLTLDALQGGTPSDAPSTLATERPTDPVLPRVTWRPVPWVSAACAALVVGFVATMACMRPATTVAAVAAPPVALVAPPAADPGPAPAPPPPTVDVDDLPVAPASPAVRTASRPRPQPQEIVRKLSF
jgi:eukaryotic-like serine/threonine-protein kinase